MTNYKKIFFSHGLERSWSEESISLKVRILVWFRPSWTCNSFLICIGFPPLSIVVKYKVASSRFRSFCFSVSPLSPAKQQLTDASSRFLSFTFLASSTSPANQQLTETSRRFLSFSFSVSHSSSAKEQLTDASSRFLRCSFLVSHNYPALSSAQRLRADSLVLFSWFLPLPWLNSSSQMLQADFFVLFLNNQLSSKI